jgi:hypothetical protein
LYPSCFDANAGLFEALLTPEDAVISDELNHASIIDGIRLCKVRVPLEIAEHPCVRGSGGVCGHYAGAHPSPLFSLPVCGMALLVSHFFSTLSHVGAMDSHGHTTIATSMCRPLGCGSSTWTWLIWRPSCRRQPTTERASSSSPPMVCGVVRHQVCKGHDTLVYVCREQGREWFCRNSLVRAQLCVHRLVAELVLHSPTPSHPAPPNRTIHGRCVFYGW